MINVEINARDNESNASVLRRFSQRIRSSNLVKDTRGRRFHKRDKSTLIRKQETLSLIKKIEHTEYMKKLGHFVKK